MLSPEGITDAYRTVLLRDPEPAVFGHLAGLADADQVPDADGLTNVLRTSVEYRTVVGPLRQLLVQEWQQWADREPTAAELRQGVDATRGRCGSDAAVEQALADGSIRTKLAFRPLKIEMDITNQCNLRCVMCHFSLPVYHKAPRRHVTVQQFEALAARNSASFSSSRAKEPPTRIRS